MAASYGTETAQMQQTAQKVEQVSQEIQQEIRSLTGQLEPLATQWKGSAAAAFQQLMQRFTEDGQKLSTALDNISQAISSTGKNYQAVEEANQSSISKILGS